MALNRRPVKTNAKSNKKGLLYKMVVGKARDEDYAQSTLPTNRWALGWDILKGRFTKMIFVNLLMLLGFGACVFLVVYSSLQKAAINSEMPFMGNMGVGYPFSVDVGLNAYLDIMQISQVYNLLFVAAFVLLGAPTLAGGFYLMRNIVWTEGIFVSNDFFKGIKKNYFRTLLITIIWSIIFYIVVFNTSYTNYQIFIGSSSGILVFGLVMSYIFLVFATIVCLFMLTLNVTYELSFWHLFRNALLLTIGLIPHNIFFAALAGLPLILVLFVGNSQIRIICFLIFATIGISFLLLVWTNYSHWVFDRFFNDKVEGAIKGRGIISNADKKDEGLIKDRLDSSLAQYYAQPRRAVKPVNDSDLKISELPEFYSRSDLDKLHEEKILIKEDADSYAAEHENDHLAILEKIEARKQLAEERANRAQQATSNQQKTVQKQNAYKNPKKIKKTTNNNNVQIDDTSKKDKE